MILLQICIIYLMLKRPTLPLFHQILKEASLLLVCLLIMNGAKVLGESFVFNKLQVDAHKLQMGVHNLQVARCGAKTTSV